MNKKILFCGAIAAALLLTACVKKEAPKEDEEAQVEPKKTEQVNEPVQLQPLDEPETTPVEEPAKHVEVERHETANTTTEIRREVRDAPQHAAAHDTKTEAPKPATPKPEKTETQKPVKAEVTPPKTEEKSTPVKANSDAQSEDDAVAAAIAAATPALEQ